MMMKIGATLSVTSYLETWTDLGAPWIVNILSECCSASLVITSYSCLHTFIMMINLAVVNNLRHTVLVTPLGCLFSCITRQVNTNIAAGADI